MASSSEDPALKALLTGFSRLLQSGKYSDLTISSRHRKYAVHKTIVCTQSSFFRSACEGNFKESQSHVIDLLDDDSYAVHSMIQYLYTLTYPPEHADHHVEDGKPFPESILSVVDDPNGLEPPPATNDTGQASLDGVEGVEGVDADANAETAAVVQSTAASGGDGSGGGDHDPSLRILDHDLQVYVLGDKYGIPDLQKKAARHFEKVLEEEADLTMAVFQIIRKVYELTIPQDRVLRDIVVARIYDEVEHWIEHAEFMDTLRDEGDFCADLLAHTVKETLKRNEAVLLTLQHRYYCNSCGGTVIVRWRHSGRKNRALKLYCTECQEWTASDVL